MICYHIAQRELQAGTVKSALALRGQSAHIAAIMSSRAASPTALPTAGGAARPRALAWWLFGVAFMVVAIVVVGGVTRLTESGLSITQWKPVTGVIPPLTHAQWEADFARYKQIGQYIDIARPDGMTLSGYQFIYWWEWSHRLLARLIGMAFALPLAWFWVRREIPAGYKPRLLALLALGGLQGAFGWLMVRSGLNTQMTAVSHFWLSIHLLTGLFTMAGLIWTGRDLLVLSRNPDARPARMTLLGGIVSVTLFIQLVLGAWMAGLHAGLASDTWPLMNGRFFPEIDWNHGVLFDMTSDRFLVHWEHRWWAWVVVVAMLVLARRLKTINPRAAIILLVVLGTQVALGIATVMDHVPLALASAHQFVGALLVAATAWSVHSLGQHRANEPAVHGSGKTRPAAALQDSPAAPQNT